MDRLTAMRVFVETVDRGSVSAAAMALDMSRAMASRYVEGLEGWLGARLLHRTTRRLALTDAGQGTLVTCREMLALADDVLAQASHGANEVRGRLRLTSSPSFAVAQLAAAVVNFQTQHPNVEVDLLMADRTVDLVQERVDLAIRLSNRIDPNLLARRLARCDSVLCATPAYLRRAGAPRRPEDLLAHRCVVHSNGMAGEFRLQRGERVTAVQPQGLITANETSVVHAAVLAGAGIAMLPTYLVGKELATGVLMRVLSDHALEPLDIQAVYLSRRHQPLALRLLIDHLVASFGGEMAPWDMASATDGVVRPKPRRRAPAREVLGLGSSRKAAELFAHEQTSQADPTSISRFGSQACVSSSDTSSTKSRAARSEPRTRT